MYKRIAAHLAALLMTVGAIVGVATPAQAWGYCNPSTPANVVYIYDNQGYCGAQHGISVAGLPFGACVNLGGGTNNMSGSIDNNSPKAIIVSDSHGCVGAPSQGFPSNTSDPDLYAGVSLGNKISSIYVAS